MHRVTLQDIFNAAWQAFIIEDRPPAQEQATAYKQFLCSYRTKDGRKCAVGLCIPDGHPYQLLDDTLDDLITLDSYEEVSAQLFDSSLYDWDLRPRLFEFQAELHDDLCDKGEWKYTKEERQEKYRQIADSYNLTIPGEESC